MLATGNIDHGVSQRHHPVGLFRPSRPAPAGSIDDLRNLLAARFPHLPSAPRTNFTTGIGSLDQLIGSGLPKSAITELISPEMSAGSASLIHLLVQAAQHDRFFVALIDGCDSFDPESLNNGCLRHLLWARCHNSFEAIKAADLLLRDGNFPLIMVDLVLNRPEELRKIPQTSWYRLQRLVEITSSACLILTRQSLIGSAQLKIVLENVWTLRALDDETAMAQLRFRIQRSHCYAETEGHRAAGAGASRTGIILGDESASLSTY